MTEDGDRKPREALLADPLVDHGRCRRDLFQSSPALLEDYAIIEDRRAVVLFLERHAGLSPPPTATCWTISTPGVSRCPSGTSVESTPGSMGKVSGGQSTHPRSSWPMCSHR